MNVDCQYIEWLENTKYNKHKNKYEQTLSNLLFQNFKIL